MVRSQLRVYYGPTADVQAEAAQGKAKQDTVTVPAGDIFPLLADAVRSDRTWLNDFANDEITISTDLYEVILAYQHFRRPRPECLTSWTAEPPISSASSERSTDSSRTEGSPGIFDPGLPFCR